MNVIYCRSAQDSKDHILQQKEHLAHIFEAKGTKLDKMYIDDGFSGNSSNRPGLLKMTQELDEIESITVTGVDRLYREHNKLIDFIQTLKSKNVKLYDSTGQDVIETFENISVPFLKKINFHKKRRSI